MVGFLNMIPMFGWLALHIWWATVSLAGFRLTDFMTCHTHVHRKKFTATAGKVENIERSESIKNHFSWKHHIINEIKKWKLWNPCRILSKCFVWRRTLMNNHSFQLFYFTNYTRNKHNLNHESYISSIYVHLSWDSIHPPHHRCFGQNGRSARPVDPRSKMVVEEFASLGWKDLWSCMSTTLVLLTIL